MRTKSNEPVIIKGARSKGSVCVATRPLTKIKPAYVKAEINPKKIPRKGRSEKSSVKILAAKKTPISVSTTVTYVGSVGRLLSRIHSYKTPTQTNWNSKTIATEAGTYCIE